MKVQILTIKPNEIPRIFDVVVLIGTKQHQFPIKIELDTIADQEIQIINGDAKFSETFRYNQAIASDIYKIVSQFYNYQSVNLPQEIGEFYSEQLELTKV
jgi:exopolysaccharide biosynthesis predicted pyruvyltransferase EpsI